MFHGSDADRNPARLLTPGEAARLRHCSRRRILEEIQTGRLTWMRLREGGGPQIPRAVLEMADRPSTRRRPR